MCILNSPEVVVEDVDVVTWSCYFKHGVQHAVYTDAVYTIHSTYLPSSRSVHQTVQPLSCNDIHLIAAQYSFIERMKG